MNKIWYQCVIIGTSANLTQESIEFGLCYMLFQSVFKYAVFIINVELGDTKNYLKEIGI